MLCEPTLEPDESLVAAAEALVAEGGQLGLQFPELVRVRCWLEAVKWNAHVSGLGREAGRCSHTAHGWSAKCVAGDGRGFGTR